MKKINDAVEKNRQLILDAEQYIRQHPETGYREFNTTEYLSKEFERLGYNLVKAEDIPGFYTVIDTNRPGPEVLIIGELDSLICPNHKAADKNTGYAHACGHHIQVANLLGIAAALKEPGILDRLSGRIRLCAVPAEELIEIEYRKGLKDKGIIKYYSGKAEFLRRGYFDGVDMAFGIHSGGQFGVQKGFIGCISKTVSYKGVSSHAGGAPWAGKNALYGAMQGLNGANAIRETFKESDIIRFHPIITHGGEAVNAIPDLVTLEAFVRGADFDSIQRANKKINMALCGGALSIGGNIEIIDTPGYAPLTNDVNLISVAKEAADMIIPEEHFEVSDAINTGSTDYGDLSCIMPVVHPNSAGAVGIPHSDDYFIEDTERACIKSVKMQLAMLLILLGDDCKRAKTVISEYKPQYKSKEEYLSFLDGLNSGGDRIVYKEDTAEIRLK